jgi:cell division protein ZapA
MGQVTVTIDSKLFRMACEDGQEEHLESLAASVDRKIHDLRAAFGDIGDQRLTMMAAIALADEAAETNSRLDQMKADVANVQKSRGEESEAIATRDRSLAESLSGLAARIERINDIVEGHDTDA